MMSAMRSLAATLMMLVACGGGDDDGPADATDAPPIDGAGFDPTRDVRLMVRDRIDRPVAGADVWVHGPAGGGATVHAATDVDGWAIVAMPSGGALTVHTRESEGQAYWRTVVAMEPGDELMLEMPAPGDYRPPPPPPLTIESPVTLPAPPAGASSITFQSPCASGSATVAGAGTLRSACGGPTTIIATARATGNTPIAYLVLTDVTPAAGVPITTGDAWDAAPPSWTLDVQNVPAGIRYVVAQRGINGGPPLQTSFVGHTDTLLVNDLTAAGATRDGIRPALAGAPHYHAYAGPWNGGYRFTLETNAQPDDRLTVDLAALPSPQPVQVSADGRDLSWTLVPGADLLWLSLVVAEGTGDVIGPTSTWSVTAPPDRAAFAFFGDVGFPFAGTTTPPTRLYAVGVRAWMTPWWPAYDALRLGLPDPEDAPASHSTTSSYDGFSIYNPES